MGDKKVRVSKDLLMIKDLIGHPVKRPVSRGVEEIVVQLKELNKRVDDVERKLRLKKSNSPIILKKKKQIVFLLKQNKTLSSSKLGELLNISRTRANEYLKDMEEEGIVTGISKGRNKFYKLAE
jgi:biotin operon repressor